MVWHPGNTPLRIMADRDRTTQILMNVVGNTIRYTPEGGSITIEVAMRDKLRIVTFTDTGVGIPTEALP